MNPSSHTASELQLCMLSSAQLLPVLTPVGKDEQFTGRRHMSKLYAESPTATERQKVESSAATKRRKVESSKTT